MYSEQTTQQREKPITTSESPRFQLHEHPWTSALILFIITLVMALIGQKVFQAIAPHLAPGYPLYIIQSTFGYLWISLTVFLIIPFLFKLPSGKTSFVQYLDTIRITRGKPYTRTVLLFLSCYGIFLMSQILASLIYNAMFFPANLAIVYLKPSYVIQHLPPNDWSLFLATGSGLFEEILFRGVILTMFLRKYSERNAIVFSAVLFGFFHSMNYLNVIPPTYDNLVFVSGQIAWTTIVGLFYGYLAIKANSLWPGICIHYLGNAFMNLWVFLPAAPVELQVLVGVVFSLGLIPTTLAILWITVVNRYLFNKTTTITQKPRLLSL
jgi:membrane protease YdiL (CAAX protease family)